MKAKTYGKKQGGKANTSDAGVVGPSGEAPPLSRTGGGGKDRRSNHGTSADKRARPANVEWVTQEQTTGRNAQRIASGPSSSTAQGGRAPTQATRSGSGHDGRHRIEGPQ